MNKSIFPLFLLGCIITSTNSFAQTIQEGEPAAVDILSSTRVFGLEQSIEYAKLNSPLSRAARYARYYQQSGDSEVFSSRFTAKH